MDYETALKLFFLLGFMCCWLAVLTVLGVLRAVRLFLLRLELKELVRQLEHQQGSPKNGNFGPDKQDFP